MNSCVWAQRCPQVEPVFAIVIAFLVAFIVLVIVAIKLLICCKIFSKAGYSWALGLLMLIPIVNIIMAFFLAFADWPVNKELRSLKKKQSGTTIDGGAANSF
jgi:uncharacterized membrane protein YhaH (DUF805 family)